MDSSSENLATQGDNQRNAKEVDRILDRFGLLNETLERKDNDETEPDLDKLIFSNIMHKNKLENVTIFKEGQPIRSPVSLKKLAKNLNRIQINLHQRQILCSKLQLKSEAKDLEYALTLVQNIRDDAKEMRYGFKIATHNNTLTKVAQIKENIDEMNNRLHTVLYVHSIIAIAHSSPKLHC